jgi:hypothetical protein
MALVSAEMTRASARNLVTAWQFWGTFFLLAALALARFGELPPILNEVLLLAILAWVLYPRGGSLWTKFAARRRARLN